MLHAYENELRESNTKYVVYCRELDLLTFGTTKMQQKLIELGYSNASSAGIWRCINSDDENHSHLDLHFEGYNLDEYKELHSPVNNMDLFDVVEMLCDWKAATERTKNGDIYKSIEINQKRFNLSPQLTKILLNTIDKL